MGKPKLTTGRIILAFAIAVIVDLIQFPITAVTATGILAMPGEIADFVVDCFVMAATTMLLGFHWVLLPSLVLELVPGFDYGDGRKNRPNHRRFVPLWMFKKCKSSAHRPQPALPSRRRCRRQLKQRLRSD
jgi:hypothetical protein